MRARKYYVVWEGRAPGIYDSWEEARLQVEGFPDAKYRSYDSQEEATRAFRGNAREEIEKKHGKLLQAEYPMLFNALYNAFFIS